MQLQIKITSETNKLYFDGFDDSPSLFMNHWFQPVKLAPYVWKSVWLLTSNDGLQIFCKIVKVLAIICVYSQLSVQVE